MTARLSAAAALGLGLLLAARAADPPAAPSGSVREAIYFGPAGPVRIRMHVSIDGRPADAVWGAAIDALFAFRDRNGDGGLDQSERAAFAPPTRRGREVEIALDGVPGVQPLRLTFNQKDEKLSKAAFAEAMRAAGQAAVGLRVAPARPDSRDLSAALFKHLDANGDGRLSPDELRAARERLAFLDVDEDEFLTAAELLSRGVGQNGRRDINIIRPVQRQQPEPVDSSPDLLFLPGDATQAVKQILAERGGRRATALKASEFGADPKAFAALDKDGNGRLDTTELTAWLRQPPDLELVLSFDATAAKLAAVSPGSYRTEPNGAVLAALPGGRFRFEPPDPGPAGWNDAATSLRDKFKESAKDGSVERKQFEAQPGPLSLFDLADRNGDGKVSPADVEAAIKAAAPLARCRVDVVFADQGNGLFELLDRNGDGRLSPRELVEAVAVLKVFAGPDGAVGPNDLVRRFHVRSAVEPIPIGVLVSSVRRPTTEEPARPAAPAWFAKMDRNGDGEVSLREFLGPVELFRKLDRDGDGLISPAEANAGTK